MLVLSRMENQTIRIGEDIIITVVGVSGGKVRIGIQAPKGMPVHRQEVFDAINREGNPLNEFKGVPK